MFEIITIPVTPFQQNARILYQPDSKDAVVIDPGGDVALIQERLNGSGLNLKEIWLTHSHLDHCGGVRALQDASGALLRAHACESEMRAAVLTICGLYGMPPGDMDTCPEPQEFLEDNQTLSLGADNFETLFTPGHAPGHICFYHKESGILIAGDTLFAGSIGRTDLPGGNHQQLLDSIRDRIFTLPDDTRVLPGHGPETTVGHEKQTNPFLI